MGKVILLKENFIFLKFKETSLTRVFNKFKPSTNELSLEVFNEDDYGDEELKEEYEDYGERVLMYEYDYYSDFENNIVKILNILFKMVDYLNQTEKYLTHQYYFDSSDERCIINNQDKVVYFLEVQKDETYDAIYFNVTKLSREGLVEDWRDYKKTLVENYKKYRPELTFAKCFQKETFEEDPLEEEGSIVFFKTDTKDKFNCYSTTDLDNMLVSQRKYYNKNHGTHDKFKPRDMYNREFDEDEKRYLLNIWFEVNGIEETAGLWWLIYGDNNSNGYNKNNKSPWGYKDRLLKEEEEEEDEEEED